MGKKGAAPMERRNRVIFGVLTFFGAAMAMGYFWIFMTFAPSTVHGLVRFPKDPTWRLERRQEMAWIKSRRVLKSALNKEGIRDFAIVKKHPDPIEWLERELVVEFPNDGKVMRVSLTGSNSHELAVIVNAVLDAYDEGLAAKEKSEADRLDTLDTIEKLRAQMEFRRGLIPIQRERNQMEVERFRRRDVSIQRAKPQ
jgi:hypothetical protein